jgi:hypothetical protein
VTQAENYSRIRQNGPIYWMKTTVELVQFDTWVFRHPVTSDKKYMVPKYFCIPTSCTIWHISLVPWCVRLDRFWHPVQSDTFPWFLSVSDYRGSDILYNLTHFLGSLVCQIIEVLTSCTIWHISLVPWCVRLDRFWHPVQPDTFPWSLGVSD